MHKIFICPPNETPFCGTQYVIPTIPARNLGGPASFVLTVLVINSETNNPVASAKVYVTYKDTTANKGEKFLYGSPFVTDDQGKTDIMGDLTADSIPRTTLMIKCGDAPAIACTLQSSTTNTKNPPRSPSIPPPVPPSAKKKPATHTSTSTMGAVSGTINGDGVVQKEVPRANEVTDRNETSGTESPQGPFPDAMIPNDPGASQEIPTSGIGDGMPEPPRLPPPSAPCDPAALERLRTHLFRAMGFIAPINLYARLEGMDTLISQTKQIARDGLLTAIRPNAETTRRIQSLEERYTHQNQLSEQLRAAHDEALNELLGAREELQKLIGEVNQAKEEIPVMVSEALIGMVDVLANRILTKILVRIHAATEDNLQKIEAARRDAETNISVIAKRLPGLILRQIRRRQWLPLLRGLLLKAIWPTAFVLAGLAIVSIIATRLGWIPH